MTEHARIPDLEDRHAQLFARLSAPVTPDALRGPDALEAIFERATRNAEERMDSGVRSTLQAQFSAPEASVPELDVVPEVSRTLRALDPVEAPGIIWPRVRAELAEWQAVRRSTLVRRRTLSVACAAAAVVIASLLFKWLPSAAPEAAPVIHFVKAKAPTNGFGVTTAGTIANAYGTPVPNFNPARFGAGLPNSGIQGVVR